MTDSVFGVKQSVCGFVICNFGEKLFILYAPQGFEINNPFNNLKCQEKSYKKSQGA